MVGLEIYDKMSPEKRDITKKFVVKSNLMEAGVSNDDADAYVTETFGPLDGEPAKTSHRGSDQAGSHPA